MPATDLQQVVSLCKRRGFIFHTGMEGIYDYGPLGVELKNNLKRAWWKSMVHMRDDIVGLDSCVLTNPLTLRSSGHEDAFSDDLIDCLYCKKRTKLSGVAECCHCGSKNVTESRKFNLMFKTNIGAVEEGAYVYLRPETAQGIFPNIKNIMYSGTYKLPFGIAQIGKAFRNEICPRRFTLRTREFEQMEMEYLVCPADANRFHDYWVNERIGWWVDQGISSDNLAVSYQAVHELAHYSKATVDIQYRFPHGLEEIEGIANRGDFDTKQYLYKNTPIPYIIEPSAGVDRGILALLCDAYTEEYLEDGKQRIVLKLKKHLAPVTCAVIPLARNNEKIMRLAKDIAVYLRESGIGIIKLEDGGNIGKAYRKHDEIGTPFCVTVDFDSVESEECGEFPGAYAIVTIRDRDNMGQKKIKYNLIPTYIQNTDYHVIMIL